MGNESSTVTAGIRDQVDSRNNVVYKLGDVTGNGELALLAREALRSNDFRLLDEKIREKIRPLLYNDGEGMLLPIESIIALRHKERTGSELNVPPSGVRKAVTWRIDKRGTVGETLLHVCFLSGLPEHMKLLAKRLVAMFPKIINDFYLCDEYYGESVLHMGICSENPEIVRYLLSHGADVSQRCCGNFFTCDDQKGTRTDAADQEIVLLSKSTTYNG
ncbi:hypothetical protein AB6A40_002210 [Gnathostoma spinigerum]|uniref:Uncharacterized protein n=1 Tax=Gnathostoma spinigerum TaxID=75299 RepID=A0ABD6E7B2_9BILA